jgi:polysaccharide pyruvyl transferase WcaK-like protein
MSEYVGKGSEATETRYIAVSLRTVASGKRKNPDDGAMVSRLAASIDGICDIISAEPMFFNFSSDDACITRNVRARMSHPGTVLPRLTPSEICGILSRCAVAVGMRLHMLVFALTVSLPAAGIAGDPKIGAFLDYAGLPAPVPADVPSPGSLISLATGLFESRGEVSARLAARYAQLYKLADAELRNLAKVIEE